MSDYPMNDPSREQPTHPGAHAGQSAPPPPPAGDTNLRAEAQQAVGETQRDAEQVVRHAGEEVGEVVDVARREVRDVIHEVVDVVSNEADKRTRDTGGALHRLSEDLHHMAESGNGSVAAEYVDVLANTIDRVADSLEQGGSHGVIEDVRSTASRHPGRFVAGSALAGFVMGRLIRAGERPGVDHRHGDGDSRQSDRTIDLRNEPQPARPVTQGRESEPQYESELTTVGAGRPGTGSIPPPPPPGVEPGDLR